MVSDIDILNQVSALARHAERRHGVIAENIANSDTPGFRARDLPSFDAEIALSDSRAGMFDHSQIMQPYELQDVAASPNGNTVSLERQMVAAAEAQAQHQTALAFYRKAMDMLRMAVNSSR